MALSIVPQRGYGSYHPCFSTVGIAFRLIHNKNNPVLLYNLRPQCSPSTLHPHPSIYPQSFIFLSSSKGYILGRDLATSFYFVTGNSLAVHSTIPDPPDRHHFADDPAVISVNPDLSYHICSAIRGGPGIYTFDIYDSRTRRWVTRQGDMNLDYHGNIRLTTGVSVGKRGYWLTDGPKPMVIMHDTEKGVTVGVKVRDFLEDVGGNMKLQLGRIGSEVGLVAVDGSFARMFVLGDDLKLNRLSKRLRIMEEDGELVPMRFESYKLEVVFCVSGKRLVMWECSDFDNLSRIVELKDSEYMLAHYAVDNGVPFTP